MATAQQLLDVVRADLGYKESPANSNNTKYGEWYGMNGQPWCVMAVQYWCHKAFVTLPVYTASCSVLRNYAKKAGVWVTGNYRPGDIVIYDWGGDGVPDHCGIVETVSTSTITAIEGNTAVGDDSDGGEVMRRTRVLKSILGAVRPDYEEETQMDNTPSAAHKEGVEWAVANGIMTGSVSGDLMLSQNVTRQQMCTMLYRLYKLLKK